MPGLFGGYGSLGPEQKAREARTEARKAARRRADIERARAAKGWEVRS